MLGTVIRWTPRRVGPLLLLGLAILGLFVWRRPKTLRPLGTLTGLERPLALAADAEGRVFVSEEGPCRVLAFAPGAVEDARPPAEVHTTTCAAQLAAGQARDSELVLLDAHGRVALLDLPSEEVVAIGPPALRVSGVHRPSAQELVVSSTAGGVLSLRDGTSTALPAGPYPGAIDVSGNGEFRVVLYEQGARAQALYGSRLLANVLAPVDARFVRGVVRSNGHAYLSIAEKVPRIFSWNLETNSLQTLELGRYGIGWVRGLAVSGRRLYVLDGSAAQVVVLEE